MNLNHNLKSLPSIACAAIVAATLCASMQASRGQTISLQTYSGITITGEVATACQVQYADNLGQPTSWLVLTNFTLPSSPYLFLDTSSCGVGRRFYQVRYWPQTNMALIPGGVFQMGDTWNDAGGDELPLHTVVLSSFWMDKCEVSKTLWDTVLAFNGGNFYVLDHVGSFKTNTHPVVNISWYDAVKWCNARSESEDLRPCYYADTNLTVVYKSGRMIPIVDWAANGYRLPTEAEWEKAGRGGLSGKRFPWGDTITTNQANYYGTGLPYNLSGAFGEHPAYAAGSDPHTSPLGAFQPNGFFLFDMAGNVGEWCWDAYDYYYYADSNGATNPPGPASGTLRTHRGGSWNLSAYYQRCANREADSATFSSTSIGFRCVRKP
jgi:formylglycine-generating enzyme